MAPVLSVIIPCYNNGRYLSEMLDCCINQTFTDWEVIVVDDQSTDNTTLEMGQSYSQKDSRIKFYIRERLPKGSAVCRNIGFEKAVGKYVMHFDADDLISTTCFEKRVEFMEQNPNCDYASFPAISFFDGDPLPKWNGKASYGISKGDNSLLYYFLNVNYPFSVWCNIYKTVSIKNILWDENIKIYTDFSFIIPCILLGLRHRFSNLCDYDYFYRHFREESGNMTSDFISAEKCKSTVLLFGRTLASIQNRHNTEELMKAFVRFIVLHYERLVNGQSYQYIEDYVQLVHRFYGKKLSEKLYRIYKSVSRVSNPSLRKIKLELLLYRNFGYPDYRTKFIHSLVKFVLKR